MGYTLCWLSRPLRSHAAGAHLPWASHNSSAAAAVGEVQAEHSCKCAGALCLSEHLCFPFSLTSTRTHMCRALKKWHRMLSGAMWGSALHQPVGQQKDLPTAFTTTIVLEGNHLHCSSARVLGVILPKKEHEVPRAHSSTLEHKGFTAHAEHTAPGRREELHLPIPCHTPTMICICSR